MSRAKRQGQLETVSFAAPQARRKRIALRRLLTLALGLFLAFGLLLGFAGWSLLVRPDHDIAPDQAVQLEIPSGASTERIAEILSSAGVISNANLFRLRAGWSGKDADLRAGVYDLTTGMADEEVMDRLVAGPPIQYVTLTIPEGFTIEQIAERVEAVVGISQADFLAMAQSQASRFDYEFLAANPTSSLEGYLFPKTYRVVAGSNGEDVIRMMLEQFGSEIEGIDLSIVRERGLTMHDWVTLASMIEREVRVADERELVSSVIYNRLERGMRLEIDATIEYILPGNRPRLLNKHLRIDSPYNTYMYAGLPPGPIASPGKAALAAAAAPADTDFIYYVLTSADGSHTFTTNYADFLEAKEKSREVVP